MSRQFEYCSCGKRIYLNYNHANNDMQDLVKYKDRGDEREMNVYRCKLTKAWHVGSQEHTVIKRSKQ